MTGGGCGVQSHTQTHIAARSVPHHACSGALISRAAALGCTAGGALVLLAALMLRSVVAVVAMVVLVLVTMQPSAWW
jgi:hypothetical protein